MRKLSFNFCLLVIMVVAIAGCSGSTQESDNTITSDALKNPNTADGTADSSNLPRFEFDEEIHDFGRIIQGEKVSYSFKFKNSGKSDLVISDAKGSCGCTIADFPKKPIPPNGEGTIDVTFNTETKKGYQNKTITIIANTQPNSKVLTVKAQIQVPEE
ncbi:MAG: DUF1573 domain-containing protein [Bacteroidota bacterium]